MVNKWLHDTEDAYPWDKAVPGGTCLEVGVLRLVRWEVAAANQQHMVAILLDLQTFYDKIDHGLLEVRILQAGFPAAVARLVVQAYQGMRYLVAEDQLSQGILPSTGILAGCPFATMIARVYLGPVLKEAYSFIGVTNVDTWVDDIRGEATRPCG